MISMSLFMDQCMLVTDDHHFSRLLSHLVRSLGFSPIQNYFLFLFTSVLCSIIENLILLRHKTTVFYLFYQFIRHKHPRTESFFTEVPFIFYNIRFSGWTINVVTAFLFHIQLKQVSSQPSILSLKQADVKSSRI